MAKGAAFGLALLALAQGGAATPALALDCAKAQSRIERAICADEGLQREDAAFAKFYFALLAKLRAGNNGASKENSPDEGGVLVADQRKWLKTREAECASGEQQRQRACISDSIKRRREELGHEWVGLPGDADLVKAGKLTLGKLTAPVTADKSCPECKECVLSYQGSEIASTSEDSRVRWGDPPLQIEHRLKRGDDEAALLVVHDGGEMNCMHYQVLWTDPAQGIRWAPLGESCYTHAGVSIPRQSRGLYDVSRS